MNKKIIAGLMSAAAVGTFWACGSGSINNPDTDDGIVKATFMPDGVSDSTKIVQSLINPAKTACESDAICADQYKGYLAGEAAPSSAKDESASSSSVSGGQATSSATSSSSSIMVIKGSSSSVSIAGEDEGTSSSTPASTITGLGSCTTTTGVTTIEKGSTARFKFTGNTTGTNYVAMDFVKASYQWSYADGTGDGSANNVTSDNVTFANSGSKQVSVTVTMADGNLETINCTPLQVNGDPITGCECTADAAGSVDFNTSPNVTWTVAGCTTASTPLTYTWNGTAGTESFVNTFAAATASYAPTLQVGNADNTLIDVTCPAVKVTDGPEHEISLPATDTLAANETYTIKSASCSSTLTFSPKGTDNCNESSCTVSVNGGTGIKVGCYGSTSMPTTYPFTVESQCAIQLDCY